MWSKVLGGMEEGDCKILEKCSFFVSYSRFNDCTRLVFLRFVGDAEGGGRVLEKCSFGECVFWFLGWLCCSFD